jgi:hypothetical protein
MKKGFKITQAVEVTEALIEYRDTYNEKGKYLGFENLNDLYTMQLGTCTDWTGFPRSGKTQVLMELLLNTSLYYGWKHLVYFPDVGSNVEIIADLLHKKTAKCFNPKYKNVISDQDIYRETEWLLEHFKVLTKADVKAKLTPFEFYDMAASMKDEIQTASIDSWKDMSHPYNEYGGYAMYLEAVLPYRNQTAEDNNLHIHTVIHPKLTEKENGTRKAPTPYDLKGGSEWFNSGKCMITVHRESTETTNADISVHKVKPRSCGNVGFCSLQFDVEKLVYFTTEQTVNGNVKRYATERSKPANVEPIKQPKQLAPNKDFDINNRIEPQGKVENWEEPGLDLWQ